MICLAMYLGIILASLLSPRGAFAATPAERGLAFLVNGDWGGIPYWPYITPAEHFVAQALGKHAGNVGARFTISLGDNFYFDGVQSVDDPRFSETFENVFTSQHLQAPHQFRMIAGNHDHLGNVTAQIAYSSKSARWSFPSLYYDFVEVVPGGANGTDQTAHFVMIDAITLTALPIAVDEDTSILSSDKHPISQAASARAEEQWAWLNHTLATSSADYIIVASHFPVWSICEHGPTQRLVQRLKPMLEKARVSISLAGHDHCAAHIDEGSPVQYHVVGAGHVCSYSTKHKGSVPANSLQWHYNGGLFGVLKGAFAQVVVDPSDGLIVTHIDSAGNVLYTAPPVSPRRHSTEMDSVVV